MAGSAIHINCLFVEIQFFVCLYVDKIPVFYVRDRVNEMFLGTHFKVLP